MEHSKAPVVLERTARCWVYSAARDNKHDTLTPSSTSSLIPTLPLLPLLLSKNYDARPLLSLLEKHTFVLLTYPPAPESNDSSSSSSPSNLLLKTLHPLLSSFRRLLAPLPEGPSPSPWPPRQNCPVSDGDVYVSERGTPMYKLGFDDGTGGVVGSGDVDRIRAVYRVGCENYDSQGPRWPSCGGVGEPGEGEGGRWDEDFRKPKHEAAGTDEAYGRYVILRGIGLCRHVTDAAFRSLLALGGDASSLVPSRRYGDGLKGWLKRPSDDPDATSVVPPVLSPFTPLRPGDKSLLYSMSYYNNEDALDAAVSLENYGTDPSSPLLTLREHVDPSLLVLEPVLSTGVGGLEVYDPSRLSWVCVDGGGTTDLWDAMPKGGGGGMVLFAGKKGAEVISERTGKNIIPCRHRVVAPRGEDVGKERRSVIYEQKYMEFYE